MRFRTFAATIAISLVSPTLPLAQDRAAPPLPSPSADCQSRTGGLPAVTPGETASSANLSDQLSRSSGVICPPAGIDPGIAAPSTGRRVMPVIPPPGAPGGDPSIIQSKAGVVAARFISRGCQKSVERLKDLGQLKHDDEGFSRGRRDTSPGELKTRQQAG
jgi:hypothetical protein